MSKTSTTTTTKMITRSQTSGVPRRTWSTTDHAAKSPRSKRSTKSKSKKIRDAFILSMPDDHAVDVRATSTYDGKRYATDFSRDEAGVMKARIYERSGVVLRIWSENGEAKATSFQIKEFARDRQD